MSAAHKATRVDAFMRGFTNSPWTGKWLPYNLQVFQRKQVVLSIDYNEADEIEINVFRRGVWEYRLPPIAEGSNPQPKSRA